MNFRIFWGNYITQQKLHIYGFRWQLSEIIYSHFLGMLLTYNGKKNRLKLFWENYELLNIIFLSIFWATSMLFLRTPYVFKIFLTLSWRWPLSYRNQSIDLLWFLYDWELCHERVNHECKCQMLSQKSHSCKKSTGRWKNK